MRHLSISCSTKTGSPGLVETLECFGHDGSFEGGADDEVLDDAGEDVEDDADHDSDHVDAVADDGGDGDVEDDVDHDKNPMA